MRFITVRELRSQSAEVWRRLADEGEIVVTCNGKPIALLSPLSPDNLEQSISAVRRARAIAAVEKMQERSAAAGTDRLTDQEIQAEIGAARRDRR